MRNTAFALALTLALPLGAQNAPSFKVPRPSPKSVLTQTIGFTDVTITYSRPSAKGRQIFGGLVPYGQVWRTGANEATTISFSDDVTINGQALPKGTYSLHTIPGKDQWTIIFNKVANQWGSFNYEQAQDALRVNAKPHGDEYNEVMVFSIPKVTADEATVEIKWTNVAVPFTIGTGTTQKVLAEARAAVVAAKPDDWQTPMRAGSFAVDNRVELQEASRWLDQSIKINENLMNLFAKARAQAAMGDRAGAIATAQRAISKATKENAEEVPEIEHSIASWKS